AKTRSFKRWLSHQYYKTMGKAPGAQALQDACSVLEGQALFESEEYPVYTRIAGDDTTIYLDLANENWEAVRIDKDGWKVVKPPVRFRRPKGMAAIPAPAPGDLEDLKCYVNVKEDNWNMLIAWLLQAVRAQGPYPILILHGEQGAAKSTTAKVLKELIDPNIAELRSGPRETRDLMIAATNSWCVSFDNLSHLTDWFSDCLCRLSTGGGFATRTLFSDDEETIFQTQRPVVLNGIEDIATRGDLIDRSIVLYLPQIEDESRMSETEFFARFNRNRSTILGALLQII
ncbi:unnamed protein product, partial [marine sediment metagenome]